MSDYQRYRYVNLYCFRSKVIRLAWECTWLFLFRPTPRWMLNSWRFFLLRLFGAKIGKGGRISPSCRVWAPWNLVIGDYVNIGERVDCYTVDRITIGNCVTISQRTYLCTGSHDIRYLNKPLLFKPIVIEDHAWVCAETFISPGVLIETGAVVAARAVVTKDVAAWMVVAGNPARVIKKREIMS